MRNNREFRIYDYFSLMMISYGLFELAKVGLGAFLCGGFIVFASLSLGTIFSIDKENKEETDCK